MNNILGGSMEINTNAITIQKMTKNGTLPRKSICLKLGYLKLETISNLNKKYHGKIENVIHFLNLVETYYL